MLSEVIIHNRHTVFIYKSRGFIVDVISYSILHIERFYPKHSPLLHNYVITQLHTPFATDNLTGRAV